MILPKPVKSNQGDHTFKLICKVYEYDEFIVQIGLEGVVEKWEVKVKQNVWKG